MKNTLLFLLLLSCSYTKAQITLEHTYDSASLNLYMVNLEVDGDKYIKIKRDNDIGENITLYNLDHSVWKFIDLSGVPPAPNGQYNVLYFSQHLFNTDDKVEFLFQSTLDGYSFYITVFNEDAAVIFHKDSVNTNVWMNVPEAQQPIYNTSAGTKMILSEYNYFGHRAFVYSLPGTYTTGLIESNNHLNEHRMASVNSNPNPAAGQMKISYTLPDGEHRGKLLINNMNGQQVKEFNIDDSFDSVTLNTQGLPTGQYVVSISTAGGFASKRFIKIE